MPQNKFSSRSRMNTIDEIDDPILEISTFEK